MKTVFSCNLFKCLFKKNSHMESVPLVKFVPVFIINHIGRASWRPSEWFVWWICSFISSRKSTAEQKTHHTLAVHPMYLKWIDLRNSCSLTLAVYWFSSGCLCLSCSCGLYVHDSKVSLSSLQHIWGEFIWCHCSAVNRSCPCLCWQFFVVMTWLNSDS